MRQGGDVDDRWKVCGRMLYFSIVLEGAGAMVPMIVDLFVQEVSQV